MDATLETLKRKAECRTPIVIMREQTSGKSDASVVTIVQRIAARSDSFVEHIHAGRNDELASIGKRIDASIINGDWLLITFGKQFDTMDFLRFVGRRLFTIMPDAERRPNLELFRLWLCLDASIIQPLVFQKVAIILDVSQLNSEGVMDAVPSNENVDPSSRPATAAAAVGSSRPLSSSVATVAASVCSDFDATSGILNDESAGDFEQQFDNTVLKERMVIGALDSKVGPLFYRRLEFSAGKRPTSSGGRAAEIRNLRIKSAQLRSSTQKLDLGLPTPSSARTTAAEGFSSVTVPRRPLTAKAAIPPQPRHTVVDHTTPPDQDVFEQSSSDILQKLHGALIKSFVHSQPAARRMLHLLVEFADSVVAAPTGTDVRKHAPAEMASLVPTHDAKGLELGDVLRVEEGVTLRNGVWRAVEVLIEQMTNSQYASAWSALARIRCQFKHPFICSPMALLQESTSELVYLVYEFPNRGPLSSVLRRLNDCPDYGLLAVRVVRTIAVALMMLHDGGFVHRDVSAEQVYDMGNNKFQLRISNRCRAIDPDGGASAEGIATRWTSPDALFTGRFHREDDVWSLGVLVWELLSRCAVLPFGHFALKEEVATALANGEVLEPPPQFQYHPVWTKIAAPCFASRMRRPTLAQIVEAADTILAARGVS